MGGSHLWRNEVLHSLDLRDDVQDGANPEMERLAEMFPSRRIVLEPGDVLIQDPGLLHRGTVNRTDEARSMLTICYFREGESHSYGKVEYSLDREIWEGLEPEVRAVFAPAFSARAEDPQARAPEPNGEAISPQGPVLPPTRRAFRWPWFSARDKSRGASTHSSEK
jgi:ectoine hydroxylase-related dioxygenase (phytanoyl-CoA dioxygenase family)